MEVLAGSRLGAAAARVLAKERLSAPAHFDAEVYSAFRRHLRQGQSSPVDLDRVVAHLLTLAIERVALSPLLAFAHEFANRVSVSDAFYVALARMRQVELLTADARLARAVTGLVQVRLVTD